MKRFIQGGSRNQITLMPASQPASQPVCLDDYIDANNLVRVIDLFVDELDLIELVFDGTVATATGRPGYNSALLLKIYIYGYLNRIQSSRRLERETQPSCSRGSAEPSFTQKEQQQQGQRVSGRRERR